MKYRNSLPYSQRFCHAESPVFLLFGVNHRPRSNAGQVRFSRRSLKFLLYVTRELRAIERVKAAFPDDLFSSEALYLLICLQTPNQPPREFWDDFDSAFYHYWNDEVGVGGWLDLQSMGSSIIRQMKAMGWRDFDERIPFRFSRLIIDYLYTLPGVIV